MFICIAPNRQKSSEVLAAREMSFELFCKCVNGKRRGPQFHRESVPCRRPGHCEVDCHKVTPLLGLIRCRRLSRSSAGQRRGQTNAVQRRVCVCVRVCVSCVANTCMRWSFRHFLSETLGSGMDGCIQCRCGVNTSCFTTHTFGFCSTDLLILS